ncbi:mRNA cleavage factor complex subunit Msi2 [Schizosaccharomyces osmophilus]|uniref:mRNA cleavage factor complex subunit Msi2 n=1 Tax=Schizosaccharomyces osmophilus TaxID=2545709 RepID=A0AAF0AW97_9SCHI|nr:mRNA cleavage factor complex subunit Msi2 [Schizosaccharomyces osmophilus]WBW72694.1 mRNA cleavage factor complex subunit Msi2 [Schizosaccharomyces osmophilus]
MGGSDFEDDELFKDLYGEENDVEKSQETGESKNESKQGENQSLEAGGEEKIAKNEEIGEENETEISNPAKSEKEGANVDEYSHQETYEDDGAEHKGFTGNEDEEQARISASWEAAESTENSTPSYANVPNPTGMSYSETRQQDENKEDQSPFNKEDGKMFIGGLNWETTDESLRDYFEQFGEVLDCTVMRDSTSGRSRGFGFLTFKDPRCVNDVMSKEHHLDGKIIDPKRAIPREEQEKTAKMFVGGVPGDCTEEEFRDFFNNFGRVLDATLMMDKDTGRPRGFGFVTFENESAVEATMSQPYITIHGKPVEVKRATPKSSLRESHDRHQQNFNGGMNPYYSQNMNMYGGMTPAMMAQYYRQMQQYMEAMRNMPAAAAGTMPYTQPAMPAGMAEWQQQQQQQGGGAGYFDPSKGPGEAGSGSGGRGGGYPNRNPGGPNRQRYRGGRRGGSAGGGGHSFHPYRR